MNTPYNRTVLWIQTLLTTLCDRDCVDSYQQKYKNFHFSCYQYVACTNGLYVNHGYNLIVEYQNASKVEV